jgi:hypothetical protein
MTRPERTPELVSELKIPAQAAFVVVAKRAASALGSAAGFSLEGIDDLNIAVAQACEKAIAGDRMWGPGNGVLKLIFRMVDGGMEVDVRNLPARLASAEVAAARREMELERRAESLRRTAARLSQEMEVERKERMRAQREAHQLTRQERSSQPGEPGVTEADLEDVAVNMIRLFVDELRYNVDSRGSMRMRMVKYLVD